MITVESRQSKLNFFRRNGRSLSISGFLLFFAWMLAFPFEGQVLYAIAGQSNIEPHSMIFGSIAAHFTGLFFCGFFIKTMKAVKRLMVFSVVYCLAGTCVFFFPPSILWDISLISSSLLAGTYVAGWGFYLKAFTPSNERIKTVADVLIYSNVLMIAANMTAINLSPSSGLVLLVLMLAGSLLMILKIPCEIQPDDSVEIKKAGNPIQPLVFLCIFIVVITINSGLMYQVINPAFAHHEFLVSWYWAVPYIIALYIMRNLPRNTNRSYMLFVGIAMIGLSFVAFMILDRSATSYLVVDTLMLGACGIYDLFWWSILGEMLDLYENPARIFGIGLSCNVLGVLIGGMLGNAIVSGSVPNYDPSIVALLVVFIILIILPLLHKRLSRVLKNHVYLTALSEMSVTQQAETVHSFLEMAQLTEREREITMLLLRGRTYKMIANELNLSENTIKTHIKNIYSKYSVQSKTELVTLLTQKGLS